LGGGHNGAARRHDITIRLYLMAWHNPHPDKTVTHIDFSSTNTTAAAPFCIAMTVAGQQRD